MGHEIFALPPINLPNITDIGFEISETHNNKVESFDLFVQSAFQNCEYLETFDITDVNLCPPIVQYIKNNYQEKCIWANYTNIPHITPIKMTFCVELSDLQSFHSPEKIEYLKIGVNDLEKPFEQGWDKYKMHFILCSKLQ